MCFMDDATTPPLKNMLGRFKFNAQHAKLNAIFATLQVPLCPLFCIVIITAWWRLGEWEFQRYLITEWRSEPKNLGSLGTCFGGIRRSYRDVFFAHFAFWIGYWSNPRIIQPVKNGMGLSFSCRFPLEHVHDFVLFSLQIAHLYQYSRTRRWRKFQKGKNI